MSSLQEPAGASAAPSSPARGNRRPFGRDASGSHSPRGVAVHAGSVASRGPRRGLLVDLVVFVLVAGFWAMTGLHLYAQFLSGMDLAIFDQGVRSIAHGHWPVSSMKQVGMDLWGDHFHPVLVLAAPFYWLWDDPRTLLLVQAACLGWGAAICSRSARGLLGTWWWGLLAGAALGFSQGVQHATVFDFHELSLGVPLLALAGAAFVRRRWWQATAWALSFLLVKEDAPVVVAGIGLAMLLVRRWGQAGVLLAGAVAWYGLATKVVIPALSPTHAWPYASTVGSPGTMLANAWHALFWPAPLTRVALVLLLGAGLLALRSPLVLPVLAVLGSRAITDNPNYMGLGYHYNLVPCVLLAFAALDGLARVQRGRAAWRRVTAVLLAVMLAVNLLTGPGRRLSGSAPAARLADAERAVAAVPAGAPVAADVFLVSHLTRDHQVVQKLWPPRFTDDFGTPVLGHVAWVVLDLETTSYKDEQKGWAVRMSHWLPGHGWREVYRYGSFRVYEKA